jgi:flagellar motility protein MotE (MotC chaperone)
MTTPAKRPPLGGVRPLSSVPGGGLRGPGLAPLPPTRGGKSRRWLLWLLLVPLLFLAFTYLLGRTVEPVRARLAGLPAAGKALFGAPVWPILWNKPLAKPATAAKAAPAANPSTPGAVAATEASPEVQKLADEAAARLAAAEVKENTLKERDAALKAREQELAKQQSLLNQAQADVEGLKLQLQAQLRSEQDRVEVYRNMGRNFQAQFLSTLTDDEILALLKYMDAEEAGKALERLDSYRAARLFERLSSVQRTSGNP